ncbi:hypothetical protein [Actinomadura sp. 9N215]|uniref:hypothetical protein n=1 Tax=Actinomadura sp. 9N215 TaxID=3375150 RepID=UPI00379D3EB6
MGRCLRTLAGHIGSVHSACVTPDSRHVLSAGSDGTVRVWELDWELAAPGPEPARP